MIISQVYNPHILKKTSHFPIGVTYFEPNCIDVHQLQFLLAQKMTKLALPSPVNCMLKQKWPQAHNLMMILTQKNAKGTDENPFLAGIN